MTAETYLKRIGIDRLPEPTCAALNAIQKAHLYAIPYENLDIVMKKPLSLDGGDLYKKIVIDRRGGYCFELNELYGWLLRQIGYEVTDCFARFLRGEVEIPKRRHHVLRVRVPGETADYLCDVGVGTGSPTYPIRMEADTVQRQGEAQYRLTRDVFLGWVLEEVKHGEWARVFSFTDEPQLPVDYQAISYFCEHAPESPFNKAPMVAIRIDGGRKTLDGSTFKKFVGETVEIFDAENTEERNRLLSEWFGIDIRNATG